MEQEDAMDFKALRAKFQDEEILLRQPRPKPVLPEKPKVVPPAQSPTHHLPAGARPSLLTSISLEGKMVGAPRVIFKDDKDSKKPLLPVTPKTKQKTLGKLKAGKDKDKDKDSKRGSIKGSKEKLDVEDKDSSKPKGGKIGKGLLHFMNKESTELVPATSPPKSTFKKVFPGFKKTSKRGAAEPLADPILDSPSPFIPGLAPLIPSGFFPSDAPGAGHTLNAGAPFVAAIPDYNAPPMSALMPPNFIPIAPPDGPSHASCAADVPGPQQETETPLETETPAPPVSASPRSATPTPALPSTPSSSPEPPDPTPSGPSTPPPHTMQISAPVESEPGLCGAEPDLHREEPNPYGEELPAAADDATSSSPKTELPVSPLSSALERALEINPGKKTSPLDQRIINALEKARRRSSLTTPTTSHPASPTPEELPPAGGLIKLPPIDYEDRARSPEAAQVNGFECSMSEERVKPELMVVPPPLSRRTVPDPQGLGPPPEKPARPPSVNLTPYLPPPLEVEEIPAPPEFWEQAETGEGLPEFEDAPSPELHAPPSSDCAAWGNDHYSTPTRHNPRNTLPDARSPALYSNGIPYAGGEAYGASVSEFDDPGSREIPEAEQSQDAVDASAQSNAQDHQPNDNSFGSLGNVYEDVQVSTKKKFKVEGPKKRKGPPKNPYDETPPPTNEEKSKIGRLANFRRAEKATPAEGPDEKELKKKEKQRQEKEKKEQKEQRDREKREQKEKEKKENEMKKKFSITGQEEAMYQATVTVTTKGRKHDLAANSGDNVSIIRTTNCPKGKWLARDNSNNYGYIAVDHVGLDIKEMMEMGKRASGTRQIVRSEVDEEATSTGSRHSNHYPVSTGSFTDDSEEWTDEDPLSPTDVDAVDVFTPPGHTRTHSMPEIGNKELSIVHQHSHSDLVTDGPYMQARHEALQKLTTFFREPKPVAEEPATSAQEDTSHTLSLMDEDTVSSPQSPPTDEEEDDVISDMLILPPPELYADEPVTSSL